MGIFFSSETTHPRPNQPFSTLSGFLKEILIYVSIFISHKSLEDSQTNICQNSNIHPSCCFISQFSPPQTVQSIRLSHHLYICGFFSSNNSKSSKGHLASKITFAHAVNAHKPSIERTRGHDYLSRGHSFKHSHLSLSLCEIM